MKPVNSANATLLFAVPAYMLSLFALLPLVATRPFPVLTTAGFLLLGLVSVAIPALWPQSLPANRRRRRFLAALVATPVLMLLLIPTFVCACIKAPLTANEHALREFFALQQARAARQNVRTDTYGGRFHHGSTGDVVRVWSDGPDLRDDEGQFSVLYLAMRFEEPWNSNCGHTILDKIQNGVRRLALAELLHIWGALQGDLVWEMDSEGNLAPVK